MKERDKLWIMGVLRRAGLWEEADEYREEARQRLRVEGKTKDEAVAAAWDAMAEKYLPLAEQVKPAFQTILADGAKCFDDIVDRAYAVTDPARQLSDAYAWVMAEFHRVVVEQGNSTIVDYRLARRPPPTVMACGILETWAAKPRDKRDGLYREIGVRLAGATALPGSEPNPDPPKALNEADAYLQSIGELDD